MTNTLNPTNQNITTENEPKITKNPFVRLLIISLVTVIVGSLAFVPYIDEVYKDGGTHEIRTIAYAKIKWSGSRHDVETGTNIYFFPFSLLPFDVLEYMSRS